MANQKAHFQLQRNTNIEILRLILMSSICLWHVIMHGYGFKYIGISNVQQIITNLVPITFLCSLFSPAVYCFMFISGWYGIVFSLKKLYYLIFVGLSCSVISNILIFIWTGKTTSIGLFPTQLLPITCNKWWFLTDYTMVFLLSPFIECGFNHIHKNHLKQIIIITSFIECMSILQFVPKSGSTFFGLLYIYILARYFRKENISIAKAKLIIIYLLSLLSLWILCYYSSKMPNNKASLAFILLGYNNPLIILMAISIFLFIEQLRPTHKPLLNKFLSPILVIYLLTEGVGSVFYNYCANIFNKNIVIGVVFIFTSIIICLIIGLILSNIFEIVFNFLTRHKGKSIFTL